MKRAWCDALPLHIPPHSAHKWSRWMHCDSPTIHPCRFGPIAMGILYHISMDDKSKSIFTYTDALRIIFDRLAHSEDLRREPELIALAVNVSQNHRCASTLCEGQRFDILMRKALEGRDDLLFKVLRNASQVCSSWSAA
jgi:Kinesin-associated protein (KAP)